MDPRSKRSATKKVRELPDRIEPPEVVLAAILPYKKQNEVSEFIHFLLAALERNSTWLNSVVGRQNDFKCVLMVGAGPNRFHLQEVIYPSGDNDIKLEIEMRDNEDHDKIAIAAMVRLNNLDLENLLTYMKTRLAENAMLREDLLKGKAMGVSFAVLRAIGEKQYRVMERIIITNNIISNSMEQVKKRRRDDGLRNGSPVKKTRKVT